LLAAVIIADEDRQPVFANYSRPSSPLHRCRFVATSPLLLCSFISWLPAYRHTGPLRRIFLSFPLSAARQMTAPCVDSPGVGPNPGRTSLRRTLNRPLCLFALLAMPCFFLFAAEKAGGGA
jgi:hypothetical protein